LPFTKRRAAKQIRCIILVICSNRAQLFNPGKQL